MKVKSLALDQAQFKFSEDNALAFKGYASKFGGIDSYGDQVVPGAYAKTLENRSRPVMLRWQHYGPVIGKFTLIKEDDEGLYVEGELTKGHRGAEDAAALLRHGAISGLSIGYVATNEESSGGINYLKEIELIEISVVEQPADLAAQVEDMKFAGCETLKDVEAVIRRDLGFTRTEATGIVSAVKAATRSDSEGQETQNILETINKAFT